MRDELKAEEIVIIFAKNGLYIKNSNPKRADEAHVIVNVNDQAEIEKALNDIADNVRHYYKLHVNAKGTEALDKLR